MFRPLVPLEHWQRLPHMAPEAWQIAHALVHQRAWAWGFQMLEVYPDGSVSRHQGVVQRLDQPLPFLLDDCTGGRLMARLVETGEGWDRAFFHYLPRCGDWRVAVAVALLVRWRAS